MLGTKPPHDAVNPDNPPYNLADAAANIMWTFALAITRAAIVSTVRGLAFWSQVLPPPLRPSPIPLDPSRARLDGSAADAAPDAVVPPESAGAQDSAAAFASYRSASGHATAQVIVMPLP